MTRRGESQERGPEGAQERQTRSEPRCSSPGQAVLLGPAPTRRAGDNGSCQVLPPPRGAGRAQKPPIPRARAGAATQARPCPRTGSNSCKRKGWRAGGCAESQWADCPDCGSVGDAHLRKNRGVDRERDRGAQGLRAVNQRRSHFCPHPLQPTSQFCTRSYSLS